MAVKRVTVIGGGHSCQTMAADLAIYGCEVALFEFADFFERVAFLKDNPVLEKFGSADTNRRLGKAALKLVTSDLAEAVSGVELIVVPVPAYAHARVFKELVNVVADGQTVLIVPGNWGAWRLRRMLDEARPGNSVKIAETDVCTHICRAGESFLGQGRVRTILERARIQLAAIPASDTASVMEMVRPIFPEMVAADNVLITSLTNTNPATHAPLMLMNAGYLETAKGNFMIYRDGASPAVTTMMDVLRVERDKVLSAFLPEIPAGTYDTWSRLSKSRWIHDPCEVAPVDLKHRYLSEDIPFGIVPVAVLGRIAGVPTPFNDAMIAMANVCNGVDYTQEGLNESVLHLSGRTTAEIVSIAETGRFA